MGCDIHGFWELRTPEGTWVAFREINMMRSYMWFGIIAGVRSLVHTSTTAGRGIPDDASAAWRTYAGVGGYGLHSHTWLSYDEVDNANQLMRAESRKAHETLPTLSDEVERIYALGHDYPTTIPWFGTLSELIKEQTLSDCLRIVVAFDN
jgi:hypothetical protein